MLGEPDRWPRWTEVKNGDLKISDSRHSLLLQVLLQRRGQSCSWASRSQESASSTLGEIEKDGSCGWKKSDSFWKVHPPKSQRETGIPNPRTNRRLVSHLKKRQGRHRHQAGIKCSMITWLWKWYEIIRYEERWRKELITSHHSIKKIAEVTLAMKTKPQTPSRPFRPVLPTTGQRFPNLHVCALKKSSFLKEVQSVYWVYVNVVSQNSQNQTCMLRPLFIPCGCLDIFRFHQMEAQWCFWLAKSFASQRAFRLSIQSLPNKLESTTAMVRLISVINVAGIPWHLSNERKMTKPYSRHTKPITHFNSNIPVTFDGFWPQSTSLSLFVCLSVRLL